MEVAALPEPQTDKTDADMAFPVKKVIGKLKTAALYKNIFILFFDILRHKLLINTHPKDYFKFEFYKTGKTLREKARFVSRRGCMYYPYQNNPIKYNNLFTNKYIQKKILEYLELPTAKLITTIGLGWEINSRERLYAFLDSLETDVVFKPISGTHGQGFMSISRSAAAFISEGKPYSKDMLYQRL